MESVQIYGPFWLQIRQSRPTDIVFADTFAFQNILIIFRVEKHFNKTCRRPRRLQYLISRQCKPNGSYCNGRNIGRWIFNIQSIRHVCNFFFFFFVYDLPGPIVIFHDKSKAVLDSRIVTRQRRLENKRRLQRSEFT